MNYEKRDEYVQQKANEYCKKEKERGTLMKIGGVEALVYKAYKNGYYESEKENKQLKQQITKAKENGVVWHDLRKNPDDLPKKVGNYIVCYLDTMLERYTFELSYVDYLGKEHWIDTCNHNIEKYDEGVIAWCEIPKYTEE